ncbi:uncharacterized protein LOC108605789 [Drosophila busckii]|uniref:uncharacterized protein LOC108605789 n=1 Tax=Drosophila busckii TaxID=30019 RepID=UPI00143322D7|nr:uncharacterized protein LOC108605789 [Drosophila busckii]
MPARKSKDTAVQLPERSKRALRSKNKNTNDNLLVEQPIREAPPRAEQLPERTKRALRLGKKNTNKSPAKEQPILAAQPTAVQLPERTKRALRSKTKDTNATIVVEQPILTAQPTAEQLPVRTKRALRSKNKDANENIVVERPFLTAQQTAEQLPVRTKRALRSKNKDTNENIVVKQPAKQLPNHAKGARRSKNKITNENLAIEQTIVVTQPAAEPLVKRARRSKNKDANENIVLEQPILVSQPAAEHTKAARRSRNKNTDENLAIEQPMLVSPAKTKATGNVAKHKLSTMNVEKETTEPKTRKLCANPALDEINHFLKLGDVKELQKRCAELEKNCIEASSEPLEPSAQLITYDFVKEFINNCSLSEELSIVNETQQATQLFQTLSNAISELESVTLEELLDLYCLAILMQNYEREERQGMSYRLGLLHAVAEHGLSLEPQQIELLAQLICKRLVTDSDKIRMHKVIDMQHALMALIARDAANRQLAIAIALATFAKVSGTTLPPRTSGSPHALVKALELAQLVNWQQLAADKRQADIYALVHSFALIANSSEHRRLAEDWSQRLDNSIHDLFMKVLRTTKSFGLYNSFTMMLERFIAFCIVSANKPRRVF